MAEHHSFWLKAFGAICFVAAAVAAIPNLAAERFDRQRWAHPSSPVDEDDVRDVQKRLALPGMAALARGRVGRARAQAQARMIAAADDHALQRAHTAFVERRYQKAERLLRALIEHRSDQLAALNDDPTHAHAEPTSTDAQTSAAHTSAADKAHLHREIDTSRMLLGHLLARTDRPELAARMWAKVSSATPVADFLAYLRGRALRRAHQPAAAAAAFAKAEAMDTTAVKLRARVERAHALAEAGKWKAAVPALADAIEDFPNYPRRHQLLYHWAEGLEALGRPDAAARAYQQTWFEFPHKDAGQRARRAIGRLAKTGHRPAALSPDKLFDRYRRLRINKHWALAKRLFKALLADQRTAGGHSRFEHDILIQLALNDYVPQHYTQAMGWLKKLRAEYRAGHRAGIDADLLYSYLSRTYSRLGQLDKALAALDQRNADHGRYTRRRQRAEFFEEHGQYADAKKIYAAYYSKWRKLGWHYTWLLYKTGDFQQAYDNFTRLSERSHGRRRAKYMYWAARTLERGDKLDEAASLFRDIAQAYELKYYGIQAANRLLDIRQRRAVDGQMIAQTKGVVDSGEQVLAVMDQAADAVESAPTRRVPPYRNRRVLQRTADDIAAGAPPPEAAALSDIKCDADTRANQSFCQLMAGQLPAPTQRAIQRALTPAQPYAGLLATGHARVTLNQAIESSFDDDEATGAVELGRAAGADAPAPPHGVTVAAKTTRPPRASSNTAARIYWEGRHDSAVAFANASQGNVIGPLPDHPWAYDQRGYHDGLAEAVDKAGELFPQLTRAQWLRKAGYTKYARWVMRDAALEFRGLSRRGRPRTRPHDLPYERWAHLIDNRRHEVGIWGYDDHEDRFPVPTSAAERRALLARQQAIYDRRDELQDLMLAAMKDVGDYHLVRRFTLGTGPWYRKDPQGPMRYKWMQAYPRAFPRRVLRASVTNGVNPYLIWALMTVESSYNPDSISPADALGLLQVIPRTGIKTAEMLGDDDFGPMDLLDEDVAIQQGAFYFAKLVDKFRGQELLAIAGYNGGPHRVGAWLDKRGQHMPVDEFVEEIPFTQARGYTKKVVRFLALYLRIYEGIDQLYIGQNMRLDYLPNPNF